MIVLCSVERISHGTSNHEEKSAECARFASKSNGGKKSCSCRWANSGWFITGHWKATGHLFGSSM